MADFEGYKRVQEILKEKELNEGRPRLVKFIIKKNNVKWTIRNFESNKIYYLKIKPQSAEIALHNFLKSMNVYHTDYKNKTEKSVNYMELVKKLMKNEELTIWVPENREQIIKNTWVYENNEQNINQKYNMNESKIIEGKYKNILFEVKGLENKELLEKILKNSTDYINKELEKLNLQIDQIILNIKEK